MGLAGTSGGQINGDGKYVSHQMGHACGYLHMHDFSHR